MRLEEEEKRRLEEEIPVRNHIIYLCSLFSYDLSSTEADSGYPSRISPRGTDLINYCFANEKYVNTVPGHMDAVRWMQNRIAPYLYSQFVWSLLSGDDNYKAQVRTLYWGSIDRVNWLNKRINEINNVLSKI